jgi:hypothetical protein
MKGVRKGMNMPLEFVMGVDSAHIASWKLIEGNMLVVDMSGINTIYRETLLIRRCLSLYRPSMEGNVRRSIFNFAKVEAGLENNALSIAFTLAFAFDAVPADRAFLAALYATPAAGQATSFGPFTRELSTKCVRSSRHVCFCG